MSGWWEAAVSAGMGVLQSEGAHKANRTSLQIAREGRDFAERMSNTEITRRVADLKAAGLNPMLAYTDGASSPQMPMPVIRNEKEGYGQGVSNALTASLVGAQKKQIEATTSAAEAQARKTNAEAEVVEAGLPYSAQNAGTQYLSAKTALEKLAAEAESAITDARTKSMDWEKMRRLAVEYQELLVKAEKAGIPAKEAEAKFFQTVPEAKWIEILKRVLLK